MSLVPWYAAREGAVAPCSPAWRRCAEHKYEYCSAFAACHGLNPRKSRGLALKIIAPARPCARGAALCALPRAAAMGQQPCGAFPPGSIGRGSQNVLHCQNLYPPQSGLFFAVASARMTLPLSGTFRSDEEFVWALCRWATKITSQPGKGLVVATPDPSLAGK